MPKRELQGVVVSDKADKTIVVNVERRIVHPVYKKIIKRSKRFAAHDESNKHKAGEVVRIRECAPKSKRKTWEVIDSVVAGSD
jgi:small subunit ribosomal protein S17